MQDVQQKPKQPHQNQDNENHTSSSSLRLDPLVEIENWGYKGNTTSLVTLSCLIFCSASSVKGYQYRIATYTSAFCPLCRSADCRAAACSSVILRSGDPPPMAL